MRIPLTYLLIICTSLLSQAQIFNSSCIPSGSMETVYRNDASRLAVKRLQEIASPLADSVTIPGIFVDSIARALYAVDNMQNTLVDDTLRGIFGGLNFLPGSDSTHFFSTSFDLSEAVALKKITVTVSNNADWGAQWLSGNYNATVNDTVNYLVNQYDLEIYRVDFQPDPGKTTFNVQAPYAINAPALAKQFGQLPGVPPGGVSAYNSPSEQVLGNIIHAEFIDAGIKLSYSYGCGDCPSGCTLSRTWKFSIHTGTACSVDYLSVENGGSPTEWLTAPCLDYIQTWKLCPLTGTAIFYNNEGGSIHQWQVSTDGTNFTNISDDSNYSGTSTPILHVNNLPSAWYGNIYSCLIDGNRSKIYDKVSFGTEWNNNADSTWKNAANWSCGALPDSNTDVVVKSGTVFINVDATVRSLYVLPGAAVNIAPGIHLTVLH